MSERFDLVIEGGTMMLPSGPSVIDAGIRNGRIAAFGSLGRADAAERINARGLHVLPGVIDTQVHFREPGLEHKEDLATGTAAAAMGGVTAIFEMPNTNPSTTTAAQMADKVARGRGRTACDYAFFVGATAENAEELAELENVPGCCGVKVFMGASTGSLLVRDDSNLRRVFASGRRRIAIHAEDDMRLVERKHVAEAGGHARVHHEWRDVESAVMATRRALALARSEKRRVHILHVTTAEEMEILKDFRDVATVEVTPQHLTLAAPECYEQLGSLAQMNPPIREARHREALWKAIADGLVDVVGSDHAPHTREEKAKPYPQSPSGMPGVQTLLPLLLDHMHAGRLSLQRLVDLTSAGAQRIYGITAKGRLSLGYDADFTLVDLEKKQRIEESWLASRCGWSPFTGMNVKGWPVATIVRGKFAMRDNALLPERVGQPVRFDETIRTAS